MHSSLLKNKTTFHLHHQTGSINDLDFPSTVLREASRKINEQVVICNVFPKERIGSSPQPWDLHDSAKTVYFSLEPAWGKDAGKQLSC